MDYNMLPREARGLIADYTVDPTGGIPQPASSQHNEDLRSAFERSSVTAVRPELGLAVQADIVVKLRSASEASTFVTTLEQAVKQALETPIPEEYSEGEKKHLEEGHAALEYWSELSKEEKFRKKLHQALTDRTMRENVAKQLVGVITAVHVCKGIDKRKLVSPNQYLLALWMMIRPIAILAHQDRHNFFNFTVNNIGREAEARRFANVKTDLSLGTHSVFNGAMTSRATKIYSAMRRRNLQRHGHH